MELVTVLGFNKKYKVKLANSKKAKVQVYSTNKKVAKVNKSGLITTMNKRGKANIVIILKKGNYKVQYVINIRTRKNVKANYSLVKFGLKSKYPSIVHYNLVEKGKKLKLKMSNTIKGDKISYKSYNKKIALVDNKGVITAKKGGKATIRINIRSGKKIYQYYTVVRIRDGKKHKNDYLKVIK